MDISAIMGAVAGIAFILGLYELTKAYERWRLGIVRETYNEVLDRVIKLLNQCEENKRKKR